MKFFRILLFSNHRKIFICSNFLCHFVFLWRSHSYIFSYRNVCISFLKDSHSQMFFIVGGLKNFAIFTVKRVTIYLYFHTVICISPSLRSSCLQMFFTTGILKIFAIFTGKHLSWMYFLGAFQPATFLKRDSNKDVFQWILQNF